MKDKKYKTEAPNGYKYYSYHLPPKFFEKIQKILKSGKFTYTSYPDFMRDTVRRRINELLDELEKEGG